MKLCSACDCNLTTDNESCWIMVTEVDFNQLMHHNTFCSYRCLMKWFGWSRK